jgi:hypothetical protein
MNFERYNLSSDFENSTEDTMIDVSQKNNLESLDKEISENGKIYTEEETAFFEEQELYYSEFCIGSRRDWTWLENNPLLAYDYFISVLLPYYIVDKDLTYKMLRELGFGAFINELNRLKNLDFSELKKTYLESDEENLINLMINKFGEEKMHEKLKIAKHRLKNIREGYRKRNSIKLEVKEKEMHMTNKSSKDELDMIKEEIKEIKWSKDIDWIIKMNYGYKLPVKENPEFRIKIIKLNPCAGCSKENPLYANKKWLKYVYEYDRWNLNDNRIGKLCGGK